MIFSFKDIASEELYSSARILFVTGQYGIFNNLAIDAISELCKPKDDILSDPEFIEDLKDDGVSETEIMAVISNSVDIETFMRVNGVLPMMGLWFCSIDYSFMTKKQLNWLDNYMKSPSSSGKLVVFCTDWKKYNTLLRSKIVRNSAFVHLIKLSYPSRSTLETVVSELFYERGALIEKRAIELFIMRMSSSYDEYAEIIDKIIVESVPSEAPKGTYMITYENTLNAMKGIENFVIDDFLLKLLVPLGSERSNGKNKIYRILGSLLDEFGARQLVAKLKSKIEDYIEFRLIINNGIIPIKVMYSVPEAKERLGEKHKLCRYSDYTFRKMAKIAAETSLRDWTYMKMILSNADKFSDESYERVLYSLINRSVLTESRLNNDIGIDNISTITLKNLDSIVFEEDKLLYNVGGV